MLICHDVVAIAALSLSAATLPDYFMLIIYFRCRADILLSVYYLH